ncbi:hypothetical protein GGR54DRAFT_121074 [Hypoxylon sp. NC1633]|nr:hypothetical protein GGR54DRAFT_121074 [Hypoxylon sp. NC1633]
MGRSENMSPESSSSRFPDRPIRPLPKRRLRERLSPDVADSIQYPPAPQTTAPLFGYPYNSKEDLASLGVDPPNVAHRENAAELGQETGLRRNGLGVEQDNHRLVGQVRRTFVSRPIHDSPAHTTRAPPRQSQPRQVNPQAPPSTASSADGYDSFENSNNKKKRKIPTAGESILNGTHVLSELGALGVSSPAEAGNDRPLNASGGTSTPHHQPGASAAAAQGISGPGRGRFGRSRNGRSPLRTLPDQNSFNGNINWGNRTPTATNNKLKPGAAQYPSPSAATIEKSGIISTAIASAEKLPLPQGQENISLLQQETSTKSSPTSQFTFTFDPQNPVSWPGSDPAPSSTTPSTRAHQSSHSVDYRNQYNGGGGGSASRVQNGPAASLGPGGMSSGVNATGEGAIKGGSHQNTIPKKSKRRGNSLVLAAKQRRRETEYQNYHHPPAPEDVWICEFCEYERIFGRAPEALIRQYEIKDRRRRREEAERRRLLEKAKMKSRKGKKANKLPAKNNSSTNDRHNSAPTGQHATAPPHSNDHVDQALHQRQVHKEGQDENEYDSEDHYEDQDPEEQMPSLNLTVAQIRGGTSGAGVGSNERDTCCGH